MAGRTDENGRNYWINEPRFDFVEALSFDMLREANVRRCEKTYHGIDRWSLTDWATAAGGECGEALNVVKKLRRLEDKGNLNSGIFKEGESEEASLKRMLADELADMIIYADLLAVRAGIDLGEAVRTKFNEISVRVGSEIQL